MKQKRLFRHNIVLLITILALALALLTGIPEKAVAFPENSSDGSCTECHGPEQQGTASEKPAESAVASFEPEPLQSAKKNVILAGGIGLAVVVGGGAAVMVKRRK